jgi:propionyl-CoA synthetase
MSGEYRQAYDRSMNDPDGFWREAAALIDWYREPDTIMDVSALPFSRWFEGGELNTCHNALDRHVDSGRGDQVALVHDSPTTASASPTASCATASPRSPASCARWASTRATA